MYVLGTAGHVDHGKTTLIKALTGIDPDRLKEEKERQMTIDLGFAWFTLPSGNDVGIVDVPGHRDFIENMLAGVGGIDAVLLVIAADEGVMPQTREHVAILKLLQIQNGLVILTKSDLVEDEEWFGLITADIQKLVQGTFLENAPILRVSSTTRTGIEQLISSIEDMLAQCPPKRDVGKARLPIDRVFTLKGFGTVITGTLLDGQFRTSEQVEIMPGQIQTRIRGIQSHKKDLDVALPGNRTAINLVGVDVDAIQRGNVLIHSGDYRATRRVDAKIQMMEGAAGQILHDDHLKCFIGTAQAIARIRVIGNKQIEPGEWGWVQMELEEEILVEKADRFILRRPSPAETIGGGVILNPHPERRYRRFSSAMLEKMQLADSGSADQILLRTLEEHNPIFLQRLVEKTGMEKSRVKSILESLIGQQALMLGQDLERDGLLMTSAFWDRLSAKVKDKLADFYQEYPLRTGMPRNDLSKYLKMEQKVFNLVLQKLSAENLIYESDGLVGLPDHEIEFSPGQQKAISEVLQEMKAVPYAPPSLKDLMEKYGDDLIRAMIMKKMIIKIADDIAFLPEVYDQMLLKTKQFLEKEQKITLAQFRDMFQTSRKFALAFLEHLDELKITIREDDFRRLNK